MAGANAGSVVAVEILVKQNQIMPMGIPLEFFSAAIERASSVLLAAKDRQISAGDLLADLKERNMPPGSCRALPFKVGSAGLYATE